MRPTALILDFDGVICDSIDECFVSSWTAYFHLYLGRRPSYMPLSLRRDFARLRPLVRGGADFMLMQEILDKGLAVSGQSEFDGLSRSAGDEKLTLYHDLFYRARAEMLEKERASWLALNRIYPHMAAALSGLAPEAPVYILSTKKPEFIAEILTANRIALPKERILYSGSERKMNVVERLGAQGSFTETTFVDDQIDHLVCDEASGASPGGNGTRIRVYLATWGYVKEEWLHEPLRVPLITPRELVSLVRREFA